MLARSYVPLEGLVPSLQSQIEDYRDNESRSTRNRHTEGLEGSGWQQWPRQLDLAVWRSRGPLGSSARYPRRNRNPAHHQARIHGNGRRISPDLGSGSSFSYEAQFTLATIQMDTSRKTADQPVLRDKSTISPKTVSDSKNTPP